MSSSPSLDGPAEVGGVDSGRDMDGLEGKGEGDDDDEEESAAESTVRRSGDGGVLYDSRYPEARDSDSATLCESAEGGWSSGAM